MAIFRQCDCTSAVHVQFAAITWEVEVVDLSSVREQRGGQNRGNGEGVEHMLKRFELDEVRPGKAGDSEWMGLV